MLINVPQYIDVEDKVAGPITAKQLVWLIVLGVILMILWNIFPKAVFFIVAIPLVLFFLALAFYRPYGQPLGNLLTAGIFYFFKPKVYVWKRTVERIPVVPMKANDSKTEIKPATNNKAQVLENLSALAQLIDSSGVQRDDKLVELLQKRQQINKK